MHWQMEYLEFYLIQDGDGRGARENSQEGKNNYIYSL